MCLSACFCRGCVFAPFVQEQGSDFILRKPVSAAMPRKGFNFTKLKQNVSKTQSSITENGDKPKAVVAAKQLTLSKFFFSAKSASEKSFDQLMKNTEHGVESSSEKRGSTSSNDAVLVSFKKQKVEESKLLNDDECVSLPPQLSEGTLQKLKTFSSTFGEFLETGSPQKTLKPSLKTRQRIDNVEIADCGQCSIEDVIDEDYAPTSAPKRKGRTKEKDAGSSSCKYTPLEQQFMEIKQRHEDTILFIECGYKYRFFGKDAEIAAKELNIVCHPDHNFDTASIPTHRLFVHVRRLVSKGYKVGVVKQTETAALKAAGDNRSGPFARELDALYTKSTIIGEDMDPVCGPSEISSEFSSDTNCTSYLACLCETKPADNGRVTFGLVAVQPSTGHMIYDRFTDFPIRAELDTRLAHIQPVEMIIPQTLSSNTERLIKNIECSSSTIDDRLRLERLDDGVFEYASAISVVTSFYQTYLLDDDDKHARMQTILNLPVEVVCCLGALISYLRDFKLDKVLVSAGYSMNKFTLESKHLKLNAVTLRNLEIFQNATDWSSRGTLFQVLDRTLTKFGSRMLRKWVSQPLRDLSKIEERQEIVTEIMGSKSGVFNTLKDLFAKLPDLEKGLGSIFHLKCSTSVFYSVTKSLLKIYQGLHELECVINSEIDSSLLKELLIQTMESLHGIDRIVGNINENAAREGDKTKIFVDVSKFPSVVLRRQKILEILDELKSMKSNIRQTLRLPGFDYTCVSGQEFLIEVRNAQLKAVPKEWVKINSTKQVVRFRSPEVENLVRRLIQFREQLQIDCALAWNSFLLEFNEKFHQYSKAVDGLAQLDCFLALAKVAQQPNFSRPFFVQHSSIIQVEGGWHPVLGNQLYEQQQYVTNGTSLDADKKSCMIITGPNMGGKSSYIRQVALIIVMAQIGSYVPAEAASLGIFDAVYTRMGATDEIYHGRSTFMVELTETAEIMRHATSQSLVILDELGRGTSTHDGVAIAHATLHYFLTEVNCLMMFVTHYTILTEMERLFPGKVSNCHMSFLVDSQNHGSESTTAVTFLYRLAPGVAAGSYGLNVALLAELPESIICIATQKSSEMEKEFLQHKQKGAVFQKLWLEKDTKLLPTYQLELV